MKFYEFNTRDFNYYALIGANNIERAIAMYIYNICEIEEDEKESIPVEITREQAFEQYATCLEEEDISRDEALQLFCRYTKKYPAYLLLIDGDLA